jgi:hypothetical protein
MPHIRKYEPQDILQGASETGSREGGEKNLEEEEKS